jgi:SAM-dependent methyltransferase
VWKILLGNLLFVMGLTRSPGKLCLNCGWEGRSFLPYYYVDCYRENVTCPNCGIIDRYRTLIAMMPFIKNEVSPMRNDIRCLDIAPMPFTPDFIKTQLGAKSVVTFDLHNPAAQIQGDIESMPFDAASFDLIVCYEVLDYIAKDSAAISEIYRVLAGNGYALLRVGYDPNGETIEYDKPDADDSFHIRRYGKDFPGRLRKPGFRVIEIQPGDHLAPDLISQTGSETGVFFILKKDAKHL